MYGICVCCGQFGSRGRQYLVRFLHSTVAVRVGGGWMQLAEFLDVNDPCRGDLAVCCQRVVPKVLGLKKQQYKSSDQFIFLHNLHKLQCTYSIVFAASLFQSWRRVQLAPEESPRQTQRHHFHLIVMCHGSVLSAMGTNRSQTKVSDWSLRLWSQQKMKWPNVRDWNIKQ